MPPAHRRRVQMARAQTDRPGRVARDGSGLWGDAKRSAAGVLARSFSVSRDKAPNRAAASLSLLAALPIFKEPQLSSLKRSHNQMGGAVVR
jgi:hypothetical protein